MLGSPSRSLNGKLLLLHVFSQVGPLFLLLKSRRRGRLIESQSEAMDRLLPLLIRSLKLILKSFGNSQGSRERAHQGGHCRHLIRNGWMTLMQDMNDAKRCGDGKTSLPRQSYRNLIQRACIDSYQTFNLISQTLCQSLFKYYRKGLVFERTILGTA